MARLLLILFALVIATPVLAPTGKSQAQALVSQRVSDSLEQTTRSENGVTPTRITARASGLERDLITDASVKTHTLSNEDIDTLIERGELSITLPGEPIFVLTLTQLSQRADIQHLSLRSIEGLPSTISRRGDHFSASLATRSGTFKVRSAGGQTWLISNDELDWRMLPHLNDSRRPV